MKYADVVVTVLIIINEITDGGVTVKPPASKRIPVTKRA